MRYHEILESRFGTFTAAQAKEIGSCAIIAMTHVTGKSWDEVWEFAKPAFGKYGMNAGGIATTMRLMGWDNHGYYKLMQTRMNVRQAEAYLKANDPDVRLICSINVDRMPHSVAFTDGQFHNVLGAYRSQVHLAYRYTRIG